MDKPYIILFFKDKYRLFKIKALLESKHYHRIINIVDLSDETDPKSAAEKLYKQGKDAALLFSDIAIQSVNGSHVIYILKKIFPDISPAIFTSSFIRESITEEITTRGVKAYIEKTNDPAKTKEVIDKHLIKFFSDTHTDIAVIFKELHSKKLNRFEEFFKSRYSVWRQQGWIDENPHNLDIDEFDFYSNTYCAFEVGIHKFGSAGGIRVTHPTKPTSAQAIIEEIMRRNNFQFSEKALRVNRSPVIAGFNSEKNVDSPASNNGPFGALPAMKVHNDQNELDTYFQTILDREHDREFCEVGRLWIKPKFRGLYYGIKLNEIIHEEVIANLIFNQITDVLICCNPLHYDSYFQKLGLEPVPGIQLREYYETNSPSMAYRLDVRNIFDPKKVKLNPGPAERIFIYLEKLKREKENPNNFVSCVCSNLKKCLQKDYLKPINEPVDYHCPLRVQRLLASVF